MMLTQGATLVKPTLYGNRRAIRVFLEWPFTASKHNKITTNQNYTSQLHFFASPSAVRLLVPAKNKDAPLAAYKFRQVFRLTNLFNPTAHIGFASDLDTYRFPIAYRQYIEYME